MELLFQGRFDQKIDQKGRIQLPQSFRSQLLPAQDLYFTTAIYQGQPHLDVYTTYEWQKLNERISKMPSLKPEVQAFKRFYLSAGQKVEFDPQGRLLIPKLHRHHAQLESEILVVGMGQKFEIWNQEIWNKIYGGLADGFEALLSSLSELEGDEPS